MKHFLCRIGLLLVFPLYSEIQEGGLIGVEKASCRALELSIDLERLHHRDESLTLERRLEILKWLPSLQGSYSRSESIVRFEQDKKSSVLRLRLKQPVPSLLRIRSQQKQRELQKEETATERTHLERRLAAGVRISYCRLYLLAKQYHYFGRELEGWTGMSKIAQSRFNLKEISRQELHRVHLNLEQQKNRQLELRLELQTALSQLIYQTDQKEIEIEWDTGGKEVEDQLFQHPEETASLLNQTELPLSPQDPSAPEKNRKIKQFQIRQDGVKLELNQQLIWMIPEINYSLNWESLNSGGYRLVERPSHSLEFRISLPGISLESAVELDSQPGEVTAAGSSSQQLSGGGWHSIVKMKRLKEQSEQLAKEHARYLKEFELHTAVLLSQHVQKRKELQLLQKQQKLAASELEIGKLQYRQGEVPLYRLDSLEQKLREGYLSLMALRLALFELTESIALHLGCSRRELYNE